ncbi:Asp-tRNA(Asn)/Glu-tRNA(Gln) amidotransferase subunit GatC [Candidatus Dojkabacteria bacterium]|nr:Asp-tRNA(Asn)/Glu-tRNA(Gln) amidotransferase subunit GatC [Candidatus Dojkabacteria bacterium]
MKKLTQEDIKHTAFLAHIKLSKNDIEKYEKELNSILSYVDILNEIDTSDVKETSQVTDISNRKRKDIDSSSLPQSEALSNTKNKARGYFVTKK